MPQAKRSVSRDVVTAWRYWWVQEGDDRLFSPYGNGRKWPAWDHETHTAVCLAKGDRHAPPVKGCDCGVYGSLNLPDVLYQALVIRHIWERRWQRNKVFSLTAAPMPQVILVVGKIKVTGALFQEDPEDRHVNEIRGVRATIKRLWICDGVPRAPRLQAKLAERYDVPVEIGRPTYDAEEWAQRSRSPRWDWAALARIPGGLTPPRRPGTGKRGVPA